MFLFAQAEGVDKVKPNENIYTPVGAYGANDDYKYSKKITAENYGTNPIDKSITFSSSTNSPFGSYGSLFMYEDAGEAQDWRGFNIIAPKLEMKIQQHKDDVSNIGIGSDSVGANTETYTGKKAQMPFGQPNGDTNIFPFYSFPLNGIILGIGYIGIRELYTKPSDSSGGTWLYYYNTEFYSLNEFDDYLNFRTYPESGTYHRIALFVTAVTLCWIKNSGISDLNDVGSNLAFFNVNNFEFMPIIGNGYSAWDWQSVNVNTPFYFPFQINKINGANGQRIIDANMQSVTNVSHIDPLNSSYDGGGFITGLNVGDFAVFPTPSGQVTSGVTNCNHWESGLENVTPEKIRKALATLGLMFAPDYRYSNGQSINIESYSDRVYVPINIDGFYNGEYKTYTYLRDTPEIFQTNSEKKSFQMFTDTSENAGLAPFINGNPDPSSGHSPIDPNEEQKVTDIELNTPNLTTISVFNTCYAMNKTGVTNLKNYLWNSDDNIFNQLIDNAKLYNKPIDAIVRLMLFPFDVRRGQGGTVRNVVFGREELTGVNGVEIPNNMRTVFDLGYAYLYRKFEDFRDFEPYTTATLYIPYCSPINLNTTIYQGKKISVKLAVDYNTGDCTAVIYGDGIPLDYSSGKCGVSIAVSAADSSRHDMKVVEDISKMASDVYYRNPLGVLDGAFQTFQDFGDIDILQRGAPSSGVAQTLPQYCYLVVTRPESDEQAGYNRTVGYACNKWQTLGSKHGFVMVENPQLDGLSATEQEKEILKNLLENGVYV